MDSRRKLEKNLPTTVSFVRRIFVLIFPSGGMIEKPKTRLFDVIDFDSLVIAFDLSQMPGR